MECKLCSWLPEYQYYQFDMYKIQGYNTVATNKKCLFCFYDCFYYVFYFFTVGHSTHMFMSLIKFYVYAMFNR